MIGCRCETEEGEYLGEVKNIVNLSSDVYTVEKDGKQMMFPSVKGGVKSVDVEAKLVVLVKSVLDEIAVY